MHGSQRQPAHTGPFSQSCFSALDRQKQPNLKAMVNQEIFTVQLRAQLKLSALLQPMFSSSIVWGGDSKVTPKWSKRKVTFAEERGSLLTPWDHSPKRQRYFQETPPAAHIQQAQLAGQAARLKRKWHKGLHPPAHFSAPSLKWEHQLNPPP